MNAFRAWLSAVLPLAIGLVFPVPAVGQVTREQQDQIQRQEKFEALWGECREIWFQGREDLSRQERADLFRRFTSERELTARQKDCILRMGDVLIDKQWDRFRDGAARWLGTMGHAYCIPPLLAVLRDEEDNSDVRVHCVLALGHIADKRVVDALIDAITHRDGNVAGNAYRQLNKLLSFDGGFALSEIPHPAIGPGHWEDDLQLRMELRKKYRQWWKKHRDRVKLNRSATFMSP